MSIGTMVIELHEFNDKKKKKKNTMDKMQKLNFFIIWPKSGNLMKYLVHRLLLTCSVLSNQIDLKLKFRSGTHGLNEELGRHRGREGKVECTLCGAECESVVHVLWECPAYSNCRLAFLKKLQELLGDKYIDFDSLNYLEKTSYVLGVQSPQHQHIKLVYKGGYENKGSYVVHDLTGNEHHTQPSIQWSECVYS